MRGKKTDPVFISQFIKESVQNGAETPAQIIERAKKMVEQIDVEIKSIDGKKIVRSKLLDVIQSFEKSINDKSEEAKLLPFFKLEYPGMCKLLCDLIRKGPIEIGERLMPLGSGENDPTMRFSVKQLLECKVFSRDGSQVKCGERFDEYMSFVLREDT